MVLNARISFGHARIRIPRPVKLWHWFRAADTSRWRWRNGARPSGSVHGRGSRSPSDGRGDEPAGLARAELRPNVAAPFTGLSGERVRPTLGCWRACTAYAKPREWAYMTVRDPAVGLRFRQVTIRLDLDHTRALYGLVSATRPKSMLFSCLRVRAQLRKWP